MTKHDTWKRIIAAMLVPAMVLVLSGCSGNAKTNKIVNDRKAAKERAEIVLNCFMERDVSTLKSLFSEAVASSYDLDAEIPMLFDSIDGEIVSYDQPSGSIGPESREAGIVVSQWQYGTIDNIVTDTGKHYLVQFSAWYILDEDPSKEGVEFISVGQFGEGDCVVKSVWAGDYTPENTPETYEIGVIEY